MLALEVEDQRRELRTDAALRRSLLPKIENLLSQLRHLSGETATKAETAHLEWLEAAVTSWEEKLSSIWNTPRDIRSEIGLPTRPRRVPTSHADIQSDLATMAYFLGESRKVHGLAQRIRELGVHRAIPSTPAEQEQDWRAASVYFASDVLAGRTSFMHLEAASWRELEWVRFEDVKRLNAYHLALVDSFSQNPAAYYLRACMQLRETLLDVNIKVPEDQFRTVASLLFPNGDSHASPAAPSFSPPEDLKSRKASMRWETRMRRAEAGSAEADWREACNYATLFYCNVACAIEGDSSQREKSMKNALSAFGEPWRSHELINCLEAAIAIYFFDPQLILSCWKDRSDFF